MPSPEEIYLRSPRHLQTLLANAASIGVWRNRYGPDFPSLLRDYEARDGWGPEEYSAFSQARRTLALSRAARTPFYQQVFREMGAHWTELVPQDAFAQIPITDKQSLRDHPEAFRPRPPLDTDALVRTSGTTGVPTELLKHRRAVEEQWAVWWRYRRWHGIGLNSRCALFAGRRIMRDDQTAPYWRHNYVGRETRFSTYHISQETAPLYVRQINNEGIGWIHGFSSAIANLARFVVDDGLRVTAPISAVTLGGENVLPWQADLIEAAFGRRPVHHYGLTEQVANASTCPSGSLHIDEDFAYVELISTGHGSQRIIGTPFTNEATALLRYDTGDLTRGISGDCGCGRPTARLDGIDGRGDESITLTDGRMVGPRRAFRAELNLAEAQIVQHPDLSLTVRYVPGSNWSETSPGELDEALREFVGHDLPIRYERMMAIPKTATGKLRLVVKEPRSPKDST